MTTSASSQVRRTAFSAALALGIAQSHSSRLLPRGRRRTATIHPLGMGRVPWYATNKLLTTRDSRSPSSDSRSSRCRCNAVVGQRRDRCGSTPAPASASASPASPSPPRYAASATAKAAAHTTTEASTSKSAATKSTTAATGGCLLRQSKNQQDCASDENGDPAHGHLREGLTAQLSHSSSPSGVRLNPYLDRCLLGWVTGVENTPFFQDSASPRGSQPTVCRAGYITFLDKCCESRFVRQGDIGGRPSGKCSQKRQIVQRHSLPFAAHARRFRLLLLHVPLKSRNRIFLA